MDIDVCRITEKADGSEYNTLLASDIDQKKILGAIFQVWLPKITMMPVETIKDNIINSVELAWETLEWKKNATLNKRCKHIFDYIQKGGYSKKSLMVVIMNTILSSEGHGLIV
jgi:hypothetical protein